MVHGMWGGGWIWEPLKNHLQEQGYHCIAPTLRYHDISPSDTPDPRLGNTSLADYVEDLCQLIATLDEKPIAIGHSMGGMIVQLLAQKGVLAGMILCAPAPPSDIPALSWGGIKSFAGLIRQWGFWRKPHRPSFASMVYSSLQLIPQEQRQHYYDQVVYDSGRAVVEIALPFLDRNHTTRVDEANVTCPALVLAGGRDCLIPLKAIGKVAKKYGADFNVLEDQTHWLVIETGWQQAAAMIEKWLAKNA
ncbi:MAG: hypothetical protein AseanaTS_05780 [Candidatus Pelagadaptatus aseana]